MQWYFPNCLGALDGKHVQIQQWFAILQLQAVQLALVDALCRILYVDVGLYDRISEGGVFSSCSLSTALESNLLHIPVECKLLGSSCTVTPFVFVADDAFPLKTYIMKLFGSKNLSHHHSIYS